VRAAPIDAGKPPNCGEIRVLIVDNDPDSTEETVKLAALNGHRTETAANGPMALQRVAPFRPHLVLVNIGMPGMEGMGFAPALRGMNLMTEPVLAAVSDHTLPYAKRRCAEFDFDHYLIKPLSGIEYEQVVRFVTGISRTRETFLSLQSAHKGAVYPFNWSQLGFCSLVLDCVPNLRGDEARRKRLDKVRGILFLVEQWIDKELDLREEQKYRIVAQLADLKMRHEILRNARFRSG
jgi:CheY-like chemotaxis protein